MKECPRCRRSYDDSQAFCFDDGTGLIGRSLPTSERASVLPHRKRKLPYVLLGSLLLIGVAAIGWLLMRPNPTDANALRPVPVVQETPETVPSAEPSLATPLTLATSTPVTSLTPPPEEDLTTNMAEVPANTQFAGTLPPKTDPETQKQLPVIMRAEDHSILFALHQCRKSGSSITCDFSLTNNGDDRQFKIASYRSRLFDDRGNGYMGSDASVAKEKGDFPTINFIKGVSTKAQVVFDKIEPDTAKITLLSIGFKVGRDFQAFMEVKFRNVPLTIAP